MDSYKRRVPQVVKDSFPALFDDEYFERMFPATNVDDVFEQFNNVLDRVWSNKHLDSKFFIDNSKKKTNKFPKINVQDLGDVFKVEIAITGFDKDAVSLEFKDNALYIKAEAKEDSSKEEGTYFVREIARSSFRRYVPLPEKVDTTKVSDECLSYKDGIITCTLPKLETTLDRVIKLNLE